MFSRVYPETNTGLGGQWIETIGWLMKRIPTAAPACLPLASKSQSGENKIGRRPRFQKFTPTSRPSRIHDTKSRPGSHGLTQSGTANTRNEEVGWEWGPAWTAMRHGVRCGKKSPRNAVGAGVAQSLPPAPILNKKRKDQFLSLEVLGGTVKGDGVVTEGFSQYRKFATSFLCAYLGVWWPSLPA